MSSIKFNSKNKPKDDYDDKDDLDDIENLLTVHVMCKSKPIETSKSTSKTNEESKSDKNKKSKLNSAIRLSQPIVLLERNIEKELLNADDNGRKRISQQNSTQTNKKLKTDSSKSKNFHETFKVYNTRRHNESFLKVKHEDSLDVNKKNYENNKINSKQSTSKIVEKIKTPSKTIADDSSLKSSCRLCGEDENKCYLFAKNSKKDLVKKIQVHLNIEIKQNDGFSQNICNSCEANVLNWSQFYSDCIAFQKKLNNCIKVFRKSESSNEQTPESNSTNECTKMSQLENIKNDAVEVEDNIEKMLREIHGMESDQEASTEQINELTSVNDAEENRSEEDEDMEMDVEFLEEERELVDEALLCQKAQKKAATSSEPTNGKKIIRMDRKLSETELRSLLERTGYNDLPVVTVVKSNNVSAPSTEEIDKHYKEFKSKFTSTNIDNKEDDSECIDQEYYDSISKSYSHLILDNIQTDSQMFFRCPHCRIYLSSGELPRHVQAEHKRLTALCDFCKLLFPYDSVITKGLVREHIELHKAKKMSNHYEVISNICKLIESTSDSTLQSDIIKEEESAVDMINQSDDAKKMMQKNRYRCNQCTARFPTAQLIRDHLKLHKREELQCSQCDEVCTSQFALSNHEKIHEINNKKLVCELCSMECESTEVYNSHMQIEQNLNPNEFVCPHCSAIFMDKQDMASHALSHPEETSICDVCGLGFSTNIEMKTHKRTLHRYNLLHCSYCDFKHFSKLGLNNHLRKCHSNDPTSDSTNLVCEHCNQSFTSPNKLREHVHITHKVSRNYPCPLCDWSFNHDINLKKHFQCHVDKGHTKCKVCSNDFEFSGEQLQIEDVIAHKKIHTSEENAVFLRPYSPSTNRMLPWRDSQQKQNVARMYCRECGVACSTPLELRKHQKTHKPFYCVTCQTVSNNEQTFLLHMEQHADRKHGCKVCGKRFMTRTALNLHSRTHAVSPKFACSVCPRKFRIANDWKRHERACRETHGLPRMNFETVGSRNGSRRVKRRSKNINYKWMDNDNMEYEVIGEDSVTESLYEGDNPENTTYYVLEEDNEDGTIEIDETQLAEFQEWQKTATQSTENSIKMVKTEIENYGSTINDEDSQLASVSQDGDDSNAAAPVYYSIEEIAGTDKKQYRFISQYVSLQNEENNDSQANIILQENQMESNSIILNASAAEEVNNAENVVYVDSNNIVYNIENGINLTEETLQNISGQNIIFQEQEDENTSEQTQQQYDADGQNISYVFENSTQDSEDGDVTIYLKDEKVVSDEILSESVQNS